MSTPLKRDHITSKKYPDETATRHQLADAAKAYQWQQVIAILTARPELIDVTRPGGTALYTPLHQAANGNAPVAIVEQLLELGARPTLRTAQNETALDIATRKGHQKIVQRLKQTQKKSDSDAVLSFPSAVTKAQTICALRFAGYQYAKSIDPDSNKVLHSVVSPVVERFVLHRSNSENFAAFFYLQRYLHKWGGESLTKAAKEHIAYAFLFLHLYRDEPPATFQNAYYCQQWQDDYAHRIEDIAAVVRRRFR